MTQAELDRFLGEAADILRGNADHSKFRGYVFALLFFKRICGVYLDEVRLLTKQLGDEELAHDPKMHNFVVPDGCLWLDLADETETDPQKEKSVARKKAVELGMALNEAMLAIERANQPKFDGILTNKIDFNKQDEPAMREEYDFSRGVRGKFARRHAQGTNVVVLEPDMARVFPDAESVNRSLRTLADIARRQGKRPARGLRRRLA
jgi:hypothetical protein